MTEEQPKQEQQTDLSEEAKKKLEEAKGLATKFQERIFERFKDYILGIAVLPPREEDKGKIAILLLIDDQDSKKMAKAELKDRLIKVFDETAKQVDERILPEPLLLSELWQYCYDGKYEVLADISMSAPTYDVGMIQAIKIAELHKQMVLKKFEKYIVCYVLGGSLVQGTATTKSDVDVFIVIDDTDVKKMTRAELRDKLRAIIIDMAFQAGDMTGIQNKINVQVYILTDFWDNIKEANPVIFTFLRDGVPFYDRGVFMPWKQLLEMGRVKPSQEAIELFMSSGEQYLKRVKFKLREMGIDDFFWATSTPSQAAIMLYGYPPPTPKELPGMLKELFVKGKDKLMTEQDVKIIEHILKVRKDMEHGTKTDITGAEIDTLYKDTEKYLAKLNKVFTKIQEAKDVESVLHTYESVITLVRDVLQSEGHKVKDANLLTTFEHELVKSGQVPEKFIRILKDIEKAKRDYDANRLSKTEVHDINKKGREFMKFMLDYLQRKRGRELERAKIRFKYGEKLGEVVMLDTQAFVVHDLEAQEKTISKAVINEHGGLGEMQNASLDEFDDAIAKATFPDRVFIKEAIFEDLKRLFGQDVEILLTY